MPHLDPTITSYISASPETTQALARQLAKQVPRGSIVCLEGDLGAGKTTFSKAFISAITGIEEDAIQSPTFVYQNSYPIIDGMIHHFDLYRLQNEQEFIELGFLDSFNPHSICLLEWPCKIFSMLESYLLVTFSYLSEEQREICIQHIHRVACP